MGNPGKHIQLRGSAQTNVGQVRSHNEDNVHLWSGEELLLAIVADGMGGAAAGEEASRIAVETIAEQLGIGVGDTLPPSPDGLDFPESTLRSAVKEANTTIIREAVEHPSNRGMGTTVTMVFVKGNEARFAHVGDSRAYRVDRNGNIQQITSDHSFVQALVEAKHITEEQAETHPMRNVLYRALGQTEELDVDTYYTRLRYGDRIIMCSDGLTGHVRADEIADIASLSMDPREIGKQLIALANKRGGEDNISVVVVIVDGDEEALLELEHMEPEVEDEDTVIIRDPRIRRISPPPKRPDNLPPTNARARRTGQDYSDPALPRGKREGGQMRGAGASGRLSLYDPAEGSDISYPRR